MAQSPRKRLPGTRTTRSLGTRYTIEDVRRGARHIGQHFSRRILSLYGVHDRTNILAGISPAKAKSILQKAKKEKKMTIDIWKRQLKNGTMTQEEYITRTAQLGKSFQALRRLLQL